jgi:transposase
MSFEDLPNDIDKLKKLFIKELSQKEQEISQLKDTILLLQHRKFGPQSEKSPKEQLILFDELEDIIEEDKSVEDTEEIKYTRKKGKRRPLPPELPRVEEIIDLAEEDKIGMKCIGEEVSEKLEITPAKVFVKRIVRKKYAPIKEGEEANIKIAPLPKELLPKSMASSSLVAYIITAKYCDALPLYRQENIFKRISAEITRQSIARWLIKVSEKLVPLYNLLQEKLLDGDYLQMDETVIQVLKEKNKKATSKSYMWVRHRPGDQPILLFDYDPTRKSEVPVRLLEGFKGYLQVDGYVGYDHVCSKGDLIRVGCWDHCRRKFNDASKTSSGRGVGKKGLDKLKAIYKIEKEIRHLCPDKKREIRQKESRPLLDDFKKWLDEVREKITPKSVAGKAINYAFNEWTTLVKYLEDGRINISNAWVENAIRPFCIGRKNWLFSDSAHGAHASAMFYSLIETAKLNLLDPFDYLNKMLDKLPHAETLEDFEKLLPLKGQFLAD